MVDAMKAVDQPNRRVVRRSVEDDFSVDPRVRYHVDLYRLLGR